MAATRDTDGGVQPEQGTPVSAGFNWPPTEYELLELETVALDDDVIVASGFATARLRPALPAVLQTPPAPDRSWLLGVLILFGLGSAAGMGAALLLTPDGGAVSAGASVAAFSRAIGASPTPADGAGGRPPDVTVIAEYSPELHQPRGALQGGSGRWPLNPAAPSATPALTASPVATATIPAGSLPALSAPTPPASGAPPVVVPAPVSVRRPPAAAPVESAVAVPDARMRIEALLSSYRTAYSKLDAEAASRVWPTVDIQQLARAFSSLSQQELTFAECAISIAERTATADCRGALRYVPRVGRSAWQERAGAWSFDLAQDAGDWIIRQVRAS